MIIKKDINMLKRKRKNVEKSKHKQKKSDQKLEIEKRMKIHIPQQYGKCKIRKYDKNRYKNGIMEQKEAKEIYFKNVKKTHRKSEDKKILYKKLKQ